MRDSGSIVGHLVRLSVTGERIIAAQHPADECKSAVTELCRDARPRTTLTITYRLHTQLVDIAVDAGRQPRQIITTPSGFKARRLAYLGD